MFLKITQSFKSFKDTKSITHKLQRKPKFRILHRARATSL
ncbi:hypothetical protein HC081234_18610 [Helicobacter cinaedi]|nr:hypothetical protein HC081234_18610 [Helicobacter cinaedi]